MSGINSINLSQRNFIRPGVAPSKVKRKHVQRAQSLT
jgi:hypothetical protein